jgi:hypothetical protein
MENLYKKYPNYYLKHESNIQFKYVVKPDQQLKAVLLLCSL